MSSLKKLGSEKYKYIYIYIYNLKQEKFAHQLVFLPMSSFENIKFRKLSEMNMFYNMCYIAALLVAGVRNLGLGLKSKSWDEFWCFKSTT